jgi:DNA-binding beta-propeller fold protein YncE
MTRWPVMLVLSIALARSALAADWCVLSVEEDGAALSVIDPNSNRRVKIPLGDKPHEVAVTADRKRAFVTEFGVRDYDLRIGTPGDTVAVIDLTIGKVVTRWKLPLAADHKTPLKAPHGVKLRPGETELFVNSEVGPEAFIVFDTRTGKVKRTFPAPHGSHNFIFSPDGKALYVFAGAEGVFKLDAEKGSVLARAAPPTPIRGLTWSTDNQALIAAAKGELLFLSPTDLTVQRHIEVPGAEQLFYPLAIGDRILAPGGFKDTLYVVDANTGSLIHEIKTSKTPIIVQAAPDHRAYVSNVQGDHITVIDLESFSETRIDDLQGPNGLAFGQCPR